MADPVTMIGLASGSLITAVVGVAAGVYYFKDSVKDRRAAFTRATAKEFDLDGYNVVVVRDKVRVKPQGHTICTMRCSTDGAAYKVFAAPRSQTMIVKYRGKGGDTHSDKCYWLGKNCVASGNVVKFYPQVDAKM